MKKYEIKEKKDLNCLKVKNTKGKRLRSALKRMRDI